MTSATSANRAPQCTSAMLLWHLFLESLNQGASGREMGVQLHEHGPPKNSPSITVRGESKFSDTTSLVLEGVCTRMGSHSSFCLYPFFAFWSSPVWTSHPSCYWQRFTAFLPSPQVSNIMPRIQFR